MISGAEMTYASTNETPFEPIASRPPPRSVNGPIVWLRNNLFDGWRNTLASVLVLGILALTLPHVLQWVLFKAVFAPDNAACRAAVGVGACWGLVAEKYRLILFGRYPFGEQWRPMVASVLLVTLLVASCYRRFWRPSLLVAWVLAWVIFFTLMLGGVLGLAPVETARWGGFPLTLLLSTVSLGLAFPFAIFVALGRQSRMPGIRTLCAVYVELIRGVPLISVLFMASFMFPLFMPQGSNIDVLVRVLVGLTLFTAAYLAEVIRGGLNALPKGQVEAAQSLGLSSWQITRKIVVPQALRLVVPAIVNIFIGTFKDTSLVSIVSLYDLTGALQLALGDPNWREFFFEGQLFVAAIYFVFCFAMSRYSLWVENHLNTGTRRQ
ncbi:amino acid ABC transporter permease [Burkholderia sp. L27(2015)]|uniref:amino acid ABC transporter permease n=1 Tax=Burkholderia sp. L27(2015) TaxID=1641858 RepID=UPI0020B15C5C|nr:amino acid ABC transporter permease [Burkholderia sp. L27(2015)]